MTNYGQAAVPKPSEPEKTMPQSCPDFYDNIVMGAVWWGSNR